MKKNILVFVVFFVANQLFAQDFYYWYKNSKQELTVDFQRRYITVKSLTDVLNIQNELTGKGIKYDDFKKITIDSSFIDTLNGYWSYIYLTDSNLEYRTTQMSYSSPSFFLDNGIHVSVSHLVYVMLKSELDTALLAQIANNYGVTILGKSRIIPRLYTLSCTNASTYDALGVANALHASNLFEYAEPDIISTELFCVNDTFFSWQWALKNTGQLCGSSDIDINYCLASQITAGYSNIVVAVIDEGVDLNHPDLTNMSAFSYDAVNGTSPSQVRGFHGTACAGIIGAEANNGIGIAGIAPHCPIMSISNIFGDPNSTITLAESIGYARKKGVSVLNNSWGGGSPSNTLDYAIDSAYIYGRGGKGCVMVFSSGNHNRPVSYPATKANVIAVGAISPSGERKSPFSCDGEVWGSNFGDELDVMAPGVLIPTTDRCGMKGYNPNLAIHTINGGSLLTQDYSDQNYTIWFNGTSSAAPHVSGVAALMLSVNPDLTAAQVARIIKGTAQKVGGYNYAYSADHLNGTWHEEMGHGLVDAAAAVTVAASSTGDLSIRDNAADDGTEPYYTATAVNLSPDVKLYDLSGLEVAAPECGVTYNIKVTVRNNTDQPISFNRNQLKIHWLARYSSPVWKSSWTSAGSLCGIPLSGTLSFSPFVATINANSSYTITKQWTAPALNTCVRPPYSTPLHIVAVMDDGFLTIGEDDTQFPLEQFVKTNNNVAWHQYTLSYDDVVPIILSISPNPANGQAVVNYRLGDNTRSGMSLVVASASGERVVSIPVSDSEGSATIDLQFLPGGHYVVQLVSSNRVLDVKSLVVE